MIMIGRDGVEIEGEKGGGVVEREEVVEEFGEDDDVVFVFDMDDGVAIYVGHGVKLIHFVYFRAKLIIKHF